MKSSSTILILLLAFGVNYLFSYPMYKELNNLRTDYINQKESLNTINNIEIKKDELLGQYNSIPQSIKNNINTVLPDSLDYVKLISDIDSVANNYGISIKDPNVKIKSPSVGGSIEDAQPEKLFESAIVAFSFSSTYEGFNSFLHELENSMRILDIKSLKISPSKNGIYEYSIEFETYWMKNI